MSEVEARVAPAMTATEEEEYLLLAFTGVGAGSAPAPRELLARSLDVRPLADAVAAAGYYGGSAAKAYRALLAAGDRLGAAGQACPVKPEAPGKLPPDGLLMLTPLGARFALEVREREVGA